jgi:hypothetical protein
MTAVYVTVPEIEARLRTTFDYSTTPTDAHIQELIEDAQGLIDETAGRTWMPSVAVSQEYHDYNGEGMVVVKKPGLLTVTSLEYTGDNGSTWNTIASTGYEVYTDYDSIELKPDTTTGQVASIPRGQKKLRVSYTYGAEEVPSRIKRLAADIVVVDTIKGIINNSANSQGGSVQVGPIRVEDPGMYSLNAIKGMTDSISDRLGSLRSSRISTTVGKNFTI